MAFAVNNWDQVVGVSETASGELHAFLWQNGRMVDLDAIAGALSATPMGINDLGQIVGTAKFPDPASPGSVVSRAVLWTASPLWGFLP